MTLHEMRTRVQELDRFSWESLTEDERRESIRLTQKIQRREAAVRDAAYRTECGFDLKDAVKQVGLWWGLGRLAAFALMQHISCAVTGADYAYGCTPFFDIVSGQFWQGAFWGGILAASIAVAIRVWDHVTQ